MEVTRNVDIIFVDSSLRTLSLVILRRRWDENDCGDVRWIVVAKVMAHWCACCFKGSLTDPLNPLMNPIIP
jgi:hypothetical protein